MDLRLMNLNARLGERLFIEKNSISFCLMTDKDRKQTEATTASEITIIAAHLQLYNILEVVTISRLAFVLLF